MYLLLCLLYYFPSCLYACDEDIQKFWQLMFSVAKLQLQPKKTGDRVKGGERKREKN